MSEKENANLIEKSYESLRAGDVETLLSCFAKDVVWELPEMKNVPFAGVWRGHEAVRQFFGKVFELQDVLEFQPEEYFAKDDKVIALGHFKMRLKSTGREFSSLWAHVWTIRNHKVARFYEYVDTAVVSRAHTEPKTGREAA
jgi:ketosteroid isomerase-like protein